MRVLVVEDDKGIAEGLAAHLTRAGHAVDCTPGIGPAWRALAGSLTTWSCWTWGCPMATAPTCCGGCARYRPGGCPTRHAGADHDRARPRFRAHRRVGSRRRRLPDQALRPGRAGGAHARAHPPPGRPRPSHHPLWRAGDRSGGPQRAARGRTRGAVGARVLGAAGADRGAASRAVPRADRGQALQLGQRAGKQRDRGARAPLRRKLGESLVRTVRGVGYYVPAERTDERIAQAQPHRPPAGVGARLAHPGVGHLHRLRLHDRGARGGRTHRRPPGQRQLAAAAARPVGAAGQPGPAARRRQQGLQGARLPALAHGRDVGCERTDARAHGDAPTPPFSARGFRHAAAGPAAAGLARLFALGRRQGAQAGGAAVAAERDDLAADIAGQVIEPGLWLLPVVALVLGLAIHRGLRPCAAWRRRCMRWIRSARRRWRRPCPTRSSPPTWTRSTAWWIATRPRYARARAGQRVRARTAHAAGLHCAAGARHRRHAGGPGAAGGAGAPAGRRTARRRGAGAPARPGARQPGRTGRNGRDPGPGRARAPGRVGVRAGRARRRARTGAHQCGPVPAVRTSGAAGTGAAQPGAERAGAHAARHAGGSRAGSGRPRAAGERRRTAAQRMAGRGRAAGPAAAAARPGPPRGGESRRPARASFEPEVALPGTGAPGGCASMAKPSRRFRRRSPSPCRPAHRGAGRR